MFRYVRSGSGFLALLVVVACSSNGDEGADADTSGPGTAMTGVTGVTGVTNTTSPGSTSTQASATGSSPSTATTATTATTTTAGQDTTSDSGGSGGSGGNMFGGMFGAGGVPATATEDTTTATTTSTSTGGSGGCVPAVDCEPAVLPSSGDVHQDCVDRVNQFRVGCWCLPALERWTEGEACADEHAEYDSDPDQMPHAGFTAGICENGGNGQNECPGWGSETQIVEGCLQMMYDEGPPPSDPCNDQCFQEHGHFINMTNENYTRVACGFYTTPGGDVWSVQNFR